MVRQMNKILIVDDEKNICTSLEFALEDTYKVFSCQNPSDAIKIIQNEEIDLVLLDLKIGEFDGISLLKKIKKLNDSVVVIMMTAFGSIKSSVDAMKSGAYYYLTKPIDIEELNVLITKALDYKNLNQEVIRLNNQLNDRFGVNGIIGKSKKMREVFELIEKVKDIDTNVLITGESGTGKELVAKAIHFQGRRKKEHFEAINCAAIPTTLLESELFGYEKGAFSGATKNKKGKFEVANNGSIFLDEIGEMELAMQSKLLRVLQEKEISPVGSTEKKKINVRLVAATNINIETAIDENKFREDLFYRLNVIAIKLPSLRERKEDIPLLTKHFINKYNNEFGKNVEGLEIAAIDMLVNYNYKGNVRELENIIEHAVALSDNRKLTCEDLPGIVQRASCDYTAENIIKIEVGENLKNVEKTVIEETLKKCKNNRLKTASMLGISDRTLRNKLKEYKERKNIPFS